MPTKLTVARPTSAPLSGLSMSESRTVKLKSIAPSTQSGADSLSRSVKSGIRAECLRAATYFALRRVLALANRPKASGESSCVFNSIVRIARVFISIPTPSIGFETSREGMGAAGFEPATAWSEAKHSIQTELSARTPRYFGEDVKSRDLKSVRTVSSRRQRFPRHGRSKRILSGPGMVSVVDVSWSHGVTAERVARAGLVVAEVRPCMT